MEVKGKFFNVLWSQRVKIRVPGRELGNMKSLSWGSDRDPHSERIYLAEAERGSKPTGQGRNRLLQQLY